MEKISYILEPEFGIVLDFSDSDIHPKVIEFTNLDKFSKLLKIFVNNLDGYNKHFTNLLNNGLLLSEEEALMQMALAYQTYTSEIKVTYYIIDITQPCLIPYIRKIKLNTLMDDRC